jgi:hypothetical protein
MSGDKRSTITHVLLTRIAHQNEGRLKRPLTLDLSFRIDGHIRHVFNPRIWESAYTKHDNVFRLSIEVTVKAGRAKLLLTKLTRKAALFWTRNPKITSRIWVYITSDDTPFYPNSVEEAKSLLFDFDRRIHVDTSNLGAGNHLLCAQVNASWESHHYTERSEITAVSNTIKVDIED